jgi:hypothetical protein
MRRTNWFWVICLLAIPQIAASQAQTKGNSGKNDANTPRGAAEKYHANGEKDGVRVGAELLTRKQVQKEFLADVNSCYVVVQVAVYPKPGKELRISQADFDLVEEGHVAGSKPDGGAIVAENVEKRRGTSGGVETASSANVGYASGTAADPNTGQSGRGNGVTTGTGVRTSVGAEPRTDQDQQRLIAGKYQLESKGLPEGEVTTPVAGYLYFPIAEQKKNAKYKLQYAMGQEMVEIVLP